MRPAMPAAPHPRQAMVQNSRRWMEASDLIPMFPTFVWKIQIESGLRDALRATILAAIAEMRVGLAPLVPGDGWQSGQALHKRQDFRDVVACINDGVGSILRFLRIGDEPFEITACWATVLAHGAAHKVHSHPNNYLSGVYYVCTRPGADTINFHDPRRQTGVIRPPVVELTAENTDQVVIKVHDGTLLMFPSYLEHSVDTNTSDEERISISFNVMFCSFTERLSKPLW
jgi:uncharacterized protein (TIGR02466 family)